MNEPLLYQCIILDEYGDTESATNCSRLADVIKWFRLRGISFQHVSIDDKGDYIQYIYKLA